MGSTDSGSGDPTDSGLPGQFLQLTALHGPTRADEHEYSQGEVGTSTALGSGARARKYEYLLKRAVLVPYQHVDRDPPPGNQQRTFNSASCTFLPVKL